MYNAISWQYGNTMLINGLNNILNQSASSPLCDILFGGTDVFITALQRVKQIDVCSVVFLTKST